MNTSSYVLGIDDQVVIIFISLFSFFSIINRVCLILFIKSLSKYVNAHMLKNPGHKYLVFDENPFSTLCVFLGNSSQELPSVLMDKTNATGSPISCML